MREGTTEAVADRLTTFDEFKKFIGLPEAVETERRFAMNGSDR
jgi:methylisocitrate lyase